MSEQKAPEFKTEDQMTPEEIKAQQENEDFILGLTEEDLNDPDKAEEISKRLKDAQTTIHQKRHYRGKADELATKVDELTKGGKPGEKKPEKKDETPAPEGVSQLAAIEFRQDHPELSKDVVKEILAYAGANKITPEEALTKPLIQTFIKQNQTAEDVDDASIAPGTKSGSDIAKKDWSNASQSDIEAQRRKIMGQ